VTLELLDTDPAGSVSDPGQGNAEDAFRHWASHIRLTKSKTTIGTGEVAVGVGSNVAVAVGVDVAVLVAVAVAVGVAVGETVVVGVDVGDS
jgi:hypothetical protein